MQQDEKPVMDEHHDGWPHQLDQHAEHAIAVMQPDVAQDQRPDNEKVIDQSRAASRPLDRPQDGRRDEPFDIGGTALRAGERHGRSRAGKPHRRQGDIRRPAPGQNRRHRTLGGVPIDRAAGRGVRSPCTAHREILEQTIPLDFGHPVGDGRCLADALQHGFGIDEVPEHKVTPRHRQHHPRISRIED